MYEYVTLPRRLRDVVPPVEVSAHFAWKYCISREYHLRYYCLARLLVQSALQWLTDHPPTECGSGRSTNISTKANYKKVPSNLIRLSIKDPASDSDNLSLTLVRHEASLTNVASDTG